MMHLAEYRSRTARLADFLPWAALVGDGVVEEAELRWLNGPDGSLAAASTR